MPLQENETWGQSEIFFYCFGVPKKTCKNYCMEVSRVGQILLQCSGKDSFTRNVNNHRMDREKVYQIVRFIHFYINTFFKGWYYAV